MRHPFADTQEPQESRPRDDHFRLLFQNNPLPMWVFDEASLAFLDVNEAATVHYGYSRDEFLRMRITDIRPPEDVPALLGVVQSERPAFRPGTLWRHRRKDGTVIDVEIASHALPYGDRKAVLVVAKDVTEQRQVHAGLQESRERLAFLYRTMGALLAGGLDYASSLRRLAEAVVPARADWCAIDVVGEDGQPERLAVVHTDPAKVELAYELARRYPSPPGTGVAHVLATGRPELLAEIPDQMLAGAAQDEHHLSLLRTLGLVSAIVVPLVTRDRVLGALTLVTAESGRRYGADDLAMAEDLAQRSAMVIENARLYRDVQHANAELERRVAERTAQLEVANRELESFSYSVSHDLRSPLRAIDGFSKILVETETAGLGPKALDYLHRIRKNALRMGLLIDDLLAFSRLSRRELQRQTVRPADVVQQVLAELVPLQEGRQVDVQVHDLPPCACDAALLHQVYENLIGNALKFTRNRVEARIEVGARTENGRTVYFVRDNGAGFDMRYAGKLFGVFQRLHRPEDYEGTGVGLAIVQRVVHRHGGTIWAEAEPDRGATFFFTLARTPDHDEPTG